LAVEYLKNSEFEAIIKRFRAATRTRKKKKKEFEEAKANLAKAFFLLSERLFKGFKFQLIDVDDALQEGVMIGFEKLHHFDSSKGKAFSFFTQIILNHFKQLFRGAKGYNELKLKYQEHLKSKDKNIISRNVKGKQKYYYKGDGLYNPQDHNPNEEG
jgi:DNA-directed RNA polymerase specialized sigma24 family protein